MDLQSLVTWNGMPPEYLLEGLWYISINDYWNTGSDVPIPSPDFLDPYVTEVTIPQINVSYTKTDFDMINFDDKDTFGTISMSFCDNVQGTVLGFFDSWMNSIFDMKNNCVRNSWRYQRKFITAHLVRIFRKADEPITLANRETIGNGSFSSKFRNIEVKDVASFLISGCLPKGIQDINLTSDSGDRYEFTVELECESIKGYYRGRDGEDGQILMSYSV